jgi:hypothetical protein
MDPAQVEISAVSAHATQLDARLARLRRRWILRDGLYAVGWFMVLSVPVVLVFAWLDWRVSFPPALRLMELLALVIGGAWIVKRFALPVLRQSRDQAAVALRAEAVDSRFAGRLVSRIEFRSPQAHAMGGSRALMEAMSARVEEQSAGAALEQAIDLRAARVPAISGATLLILLAVVVAARPAEARLWLRRTLLPFAEAPWPRRTQITDVQPLYRIRRGDVLRLTGRVTGEISRTAHVSWWPADEKGLRLRAAGSQSTEVQPDGTFTFRIGPLLQPIRLALQAGDGETDPIPVEVVVPPSLQSIRVVYHYPDFTGRASDEVQSGDIRAIVGTRAELTATADRPVERIELAFPGRADKPARSIELLSETTARTSIELDRRGQYQLTLFDRYGFTTDAPATFVIDPIDNELPQVEITRPGSEHQVTPATRLTLRYQASDDYGLTGASILWSVRKNHPQPPGAAAMPSDDQAATAPADRGRVVPVPVPTSRPECSGTYDWDLAAAGLEPGDAVEYVLEVRDAGQHLTPETTGRTAPQILHVVDAEALELTLEARIRDAFAELERLILDQRAARDEVQLAAVALSTPDQPLMPDDLRRVQGEHHRQARLARQAERLAGRLAELVEAMQDSFIGDSARHAQLQALAAGLRQLAADPMQSAAETLGRARETLDELMARETQVEP